MSRPLSLRNRLFLLIVGPLVAVALLAALARYHLAERTSERLYDDTLTVVALTISRDVALSEGDMLAEELLDTLTRALGDAIYYRVTGPGGRFLTGYSDAPVDVEPEALETAGPLFHDSEYHGAPVRVVLLREFIAEPEIGGWTTVQVWQTRSQRRALSLVLLAQAMGLMGLVVIAAAALVWFGINRGLAPLTGVREAIQRRSPESLEPIARAVPVELGPIVREMNGLFARLADAFAERDVLISNAAHQLRNPIAGIQAQAEAAANAGDAHEMRRRVRGLAEAARRTSRLTQQLLSFDKATRRAGPHRTLRVDVARLAAAVLERHAPAALRRGIEVTLDRQVSDGVVDGDEVLLGEAIDNLVDNALRYGCADGGTLHLAVRERDGTIVLTVADGGPGIDPRDATRLFERFERGADGADGGCGLGLAIVRTIAERHGGSVRLLPGRPGARFELSLRTSPTSAKAATLVRDAEIRPLVEFPTDRIEQGPPRLEPPP